MPVELQDAWEIYAAVKGGMVKPLHYQEWDGLPDELVKQLMVILQVVPEVQEAEAKQQEAMRG